MTSSLQPMDQGIIQNLKHHYSLLDGIGDLCKALISDVKKETISNCFKKAGFDEGIELPVDIEDENFPLADLWSAYVEDNNIEHVTIEDYINVDNETFTMECPSDEDILQSILSNQYGLNIPLDIKPCQAATITQQQLLLQTNPHHLQHQIHHQQHQHQHHQLQLQHSNSLMAMNGNERMLTATTTANTSASPANSAASQQQQTTTNSLQHQVNGGSASHHQCASSSSPSSSSSSTGSASACSASLLNGHGPTGGSSQETLNGNMTNNSNSTTNNNSTSMNVETSQQQSLTCTTLVNGSCSNHNGNCSQTTTTSVNSNSNSNNNSSNSRHGGSISNSTTTNDNKSSTNPCGPGPPLPSSQQLHISLQQQQHQHQQQLQHQQALNILQCSANRLTLSECNLNNLNNNNNNNNSINCNNNHNSQHALETALVLQHHLLQQQLNNGSNGVLPPSAGLIDSMCPAALAAVSLPMLSANASASCSAPPNSANALSPLACGYCCQPICDRYIMRVVDTSFHESCLKCATCSLHLVHSCFSREGKLYCRLDYERLFLRNRCLGCGHKIAADELVMRTLENVFHLKCFACVVCGAILKKGEQYVVKQGQLFCRFDYEKEVEMLQGYDFYGDDLFAPKLDGRRGPKRPRTILNTQQRRAFKASFEISPKPCRKVRENLAKDTGLSLRIVQVWFQNQRAKVKKIQKKAKQEGGHAKGTSDSPDSQESDNSNMTKIKDEAHSDTESLMDSPYATAAGADTMAKLRNCIKDENENAPFNCIETNKENCNKTNEPILNTILGLSYSTFQQLMGPFTQTSMINPIDRLYSMQNSYFRPDELGYSDGGSGAGAGAGGVPMAMGGLGHKDITDT